MQTVIGTNINIAKELLNRSELVAIPTETVYGLAANACNPDAVIKPTDKFTMTVEKLPAELQVVLLG